MQILFKDKTHFPIIFWVPFGIEISNCAEMHAEVSNYLSLLSLVCLKKALLYRVKQQCSSKVQKFF